MKKNSNKNEKGVIEIIEEAVQVLRTSTARVFFCYYIGSLPFVLGVFFFISDMSRNAYAGEYCGLASFALAVLFIWMKCWQAAFALEINARLNHFPGPTWSFAKIRQLIMLQTFLQPTGFILLPAALLITLPFGYTFAFYQNIMVEAYGKDFRLKRSMRQAVDQAMRWPRQNHLVLGVFFIFSLVIMANLGMAIFFLPYALKQYLGVETMFTLSGSSVLNTTFVTVLIGMTYLCMDPIVKTVYVLRCFYGGSLETGDDLKAEMKTLLAAKAAAGIVWVSLLCAVFIWQPGNISAAEPQSPSRVVNTLELDQSIDKVIVQPEFTWRMPRDKKVVDVKKVYDPFTRALKWITSRIAKITASVIDFLKKIYKKFFTSPSESKTTRTPTRIEWMTTVQVLLFVVLCLTVCTLAIYLRRVWLRRKTGHVTAQPVVFNTGPDLTDDSITADELPRDKWLALAQELMAQGNLQLAMRALYLATLAHLADVNLITIAHYKSNRDYEGELKRRAHEKDDLIHLFSDNVRTFDRVWYGLYKVTMDEVRFFSSNCERIAAFAE